MPVSVALKDHLASNVTFCCAIWRMVAQNGTRQVETATVVGTITLTGNASVIVTAAGMGNSPKTIPVPVVDTDTASIVAGKIRTVLAADTDVSGFFEVTGTTDKVILTKKAQAANDTTLNISIANDTCTGLTAAPTSANTTAGVLGTVAAYAAHTRNLLYESVNYLAAPVEPTRFTATLGVAKANHIELFGIFDDIVTEENLQGGFWKNAKIQCEYVNYLDLTMGSVSKIRGQAGKFTINNGTFTVELRSLSDLLSQDIGSLTSPLDRNRQLADLVGDVTPYTFVRTVTAFTDRRNFTVDGTAKPNDYFRYGKVTFASGANSGRSMEIKSSTGNVIELQLPMLSNIAIGNTVNLLAGYDSTREAARDKFSAMENFRGEPDLPGLKKVIQYPE